MNPEAENKGIPLYLDETPRSISDSIEEVEVDAWFPSNSAAQKLWRCLESLRDLDELLSDSAQQKKRYETKKETKDSINTPSFFS